MANALRGSLPAEGISAITERQIRRSPRTHTVLKTVKVKVSDEEGLAKLQNISDDGLKLCLNLSIHLGDLVTVFLSDSDRVEGKVVWTHGDCCGLQLTDTINSAALLADLATRLRDGSSRAVRISTDTAGVAYSDSGIHPVQVRDISQRGAKIRHDRRFAKGSRLTVRLITGLELRGVVRWAREDLAGIELLEPLSLEHFGFLRNV